MSESIIPKEEWKPVVGFEGFYEVSNHGRVKSIVRMSRTNSIHSGLRRMGGIIRKLLKDTNGYQHVAITALGVRRLAMVHHLVLDAFVGTRPEGMECCHNNSNPSDNHLSNLRWDTHYNNNQDRKNRGMYLVGSKHHQAKLTKQDVLFIRNSDMTGVVLAKMHNIGRTQVSRIKRGESWKHLL